MKKILIAALMLSSSAFGTMVIDDGQASTDATCQPFDLVVSGATGATGSKTCTGVNTLGGAPRQWWSQITNLVGVTSGNVLTDATGVLTISQGVGTAANTMLTLDPAALIDASQEVSLVFEARVDAISNGATVNFTFMDGMGGTVTIPVPAQALTQAWTMYSFLLPQTIDWSKLDKVKITIIGNPDADVSLRGIILSGIPEPGTFVLLGAGLLALAYTRRRK